MAHKLTKSCCGALLLLLLTTPISASIPVYLDDSKTIEERVEHALSLMTLEEKVAMCYAQSKFSSPGCPRLGIPEVWMSDGPHGVRMEIEWDSWKHAGWTNDSCTAFPALTCLAATFNPTLAYEYGNALGEEARYRKKDIILGPGVNIYRTPLNGRNFEYMGEDPYLASTMVVPYIQGVQKNGVAACVKHFALNNQEQWRGHINVQLSDRALNEIYLPAFKAGVVEGKAWSIMGAYNQYNNEYCCHNDRLLNKILKQDWGFDGVVVSDWGGTHDTEQAAKNGLDIEMGSWTNGLNKSKSFAYDDYFLAHSFLNKIKSNELPEALADEKARRILRLIYRTGMNRNRPFGALNSEAHGEVARKVAEEGIVLMKNENAFFPIPVGKYKRMVVVGENATRKLTVGGGSSELKARQEFSPLQGLIEKYGAESVTYSMGYASGAPSYGRENAPKVNTDLLFRAAVEAAKGADVVLFFGGLNKNNRQDCEGADRKNMELPFQQNRLIEALLKANKNTGIILISGNAVDMPWIGQAPALMQSWYLGSEAGRATANVIAGEVNPSGKLPFTFPVRLEDNSAHSFGTESYPGDSMNVHYKDDILVGYRWHDTKKIAPLFPFGHGLSYTTFEYGKMTCDKKAYSQNEVVNVRLTLANKGARSGSEVVQLYVSQHKPAVARPAKELKGFKKVFLNAGETQTISMELKVSDFAFYSEEQGAWVVEADRFTIHCAASAGDIKSQVSIDIR